LKTAEVSPILYIKYLPVVKLPNSILMAFFLKSVPWDNSNIDPEGLVSESPDSIPVASISDNPYWNGTGNADEIQLWE